MTLFYSPVLSGVRTCFEAAVVTCSIHVDSLTGENWTSWGDEERLFVGQDFVWNCFLDLWSHRSHHLKAGTWRIQLNSYEPSVLTDLYKKKHALSLTSVVRDVSNNAYFFPGWL
jgi:hypothetical protein